MTNTNRIEITGPDLDSAAVTSIDSLLQAQGKTRVTLRVGQDVSWEVWTPALDGGYLRGRRMGQIVRLARGHHWRRPLAYMFLAVVRADDGTETLLAAEELRPERRVKIA